MANRFWVGGGGIWDVLSTIHWSATSGGPAGASAPGVADTVFFDVNSGGGLVTAVNPVAVISIAANDPAGTLSLGADVTVSKANGVAWDATGTFVTVGTSTITLTGLNAQFKGGGNVYYDVVSTGTGQLVVADGNNTFHDIDYTGGATKTNEAFIFLFNTTQTILGTINCHGNSTINRVLFAASVAGVPVTLNAANVSFTNTDFEDIIGTGAANWDLSAIPGDSGDCGGNVGLTLTAPAPQHWISPTGGNQSDVTKWTSRVPLPQDNTFFDNAFGLNQVVVADMARLGASMDWTGATWTGTLTWQASVTSAIFGSFKLIAGLSATGAGIIVFRGRTAEILQSFGASFLHRFVFTAPHGSYTLQDPLVTTGRLDVNTGTLAFNGNNVTASVFFGTDSFIIDDGVLDMPGATLTLTGAGAAFTIAGTHVHGAGSTIKFTNTSNASLTFQGGNRTFGTVWFDRGASTGDILVTDTDMYADIKDTGTAAHAHKFADGSTQTVNNFDVSGSAGNLVTLTSISGGLFNLMKTGGGVISMDYIDAQHAYATPSNTWYAGTHSVNHQSVPVAGDGIIFSDPPPGGVGKFFLVLNKLLR